MKNKRLEFVLTKEELEYMYDNFFESQITINKEKMKKVFMENKIYLAKKSYVIKDEYLYQEITDTISKFSDLMNISSESKNIVLEFINGKKIIIPFRAFDSSNNIGEFVDFLSKIADENRKNEKENPRLYTDTDEICLECDLHKSIYGAMKTCNSISDKIANRNYSIKVFIIFFISLGLLTALQVYCNINAFELKTDKTGNIIRCVTIVGIVVILLISIVFRKKIHVLKMNRLNKKYKSECFKYSVTFTQDEVIVKLANEVEVYKLENVVNFINIKNQQDVGILYIRINENKIKKVLISTVIGSAEYIKIGVLERISKSIEKNKNDTVIYEVINSRKKYRKRMIITMFVSILIAGKLIPFSINFISIFMPQTYNKIDAIRIDNIADTIKDSKIPFYNKAN